MSARAYGKGCLRPATSCCASSPSCGPASMPPRSLAALDEVAGAIVQFRDSYMRGRDAGRFYGDAINSRTGPELGAKLKAFDYVAGLSMQRMLRPLGQRTPPVLTYLDKGLGASIQGRPAPLGWRHDEPGRRRQGDVPQPGSARPPSSMNRPSGRGDPRLERGADALLRDPLASEGAEVARIWASGRRKSPRTPTASPMSASRRFRCALGRRGRQPPQVFAFNPGGVHPISYLRVLARLRHGAADVRLRACGTIWSAPGAPATPSSSRPWGFRQTLLALERAIPRSSSSPCSRPCALRRPVPGGPDRSDARLASGARQAAGRGRPRRS